MRLFARVVAPTQYNNNINITTKTQTSLISPPPPPPTLKPPYNIPNLIISNSKSIKTNINNNITNNNKRKKSNKIAERWKEYQGIHNWEGLLDPLDDSLRKEILRYGLFVEAAYRSFDFDPSSPSYATCRFPESGLLEESGLPGTGYRPTKHLRATSGIQLPKWVERGGPPGLLGPPSSWIGYVAVSQDKEEIARLGRRDVVIAYRGTATCLEWLENLRATLTPLPGQEHHKSPESSPSEEDGGAMVESGFLSLYTSRGPGGGPSLRDMVHEEMKRLLHAYGDEPLSVTITGHSLGAALATLTAYDIKTRFPGAPLVTVVSFGGPRVGNRSFRQCLERQGTKVLRIVNPDDLVTKLPGVVTEEEGGAHASDPDQEPSSAAGEGLAGWIRRRVKNTQWDYAEIGRELRLSSKDCPYINMATCHELKTYLHLVDRFVGSTTSSSRSPTPARTACLI